MITDTCQEDFMWLVDLVDIYLAIDFLGQGCGKGNRALIGNISGFCGKTTVTKAASKLTMWCITAHRAGKQTGKQWDQ